MRGCDGTRSVAPMGESGNVETVLIATSGSPSSLRAVELGLTVAAGSHATAVFVHVLPPVVWIVRARGGPVRSLPSRLIGAAWDEPLAAAAELSAEAGVAYALELFAGDTAHVIRALADEVAANLIVLGARCGSRLRRPVQGRTAKRVVQDARVPVLVANGDSPAEARTRCGAWRKGGRLGPGPVLP